MNLSKHFLFHLLSTTFLLFLISISLKAQRITASINSDWKFHQGKLNYPEQVSQSALWESINIPHSWNKFDTTDDQPGYYRGEGWYTKKLTIPEIWKNKDIYLEFEGANQVTAVYLNGKKVGGHTGGYTGFNLNINEFVKFGAAGNELTVKVDNAFNEDIPPLSADFTFFGGLYRGVQLSVMDKVHFEMDNYGAKNLFVTTPGVSETKASVSIKGAITTTGNPTKNIAVIASILYGNDLISTQQTKLKSGINTFEIAFKAINNPKLWSPTAPNLYIVHTIIKDLSTGAILDELSNPLGFRWFKFDAASGFHLNGKPLKLIGASRHQDFKNLANAVPDEIAIRDVELLKEMGGNFLRVAHYPQDQSVLEACDRLGILASVEIPIVNSITESEIFSNNCKTMQLEMIKQNFNHPSIIIWAYMNEILLRPPFANDTTRRESYFRNVAKLAREIEELTRKTDPSRYTLIPNHGNFALYHRVGLTKIPMLVGWNLYQGWYSGKLSGFADFLDMHHRLLPDQPLLITEYGADADYRIHASKPIRFDKSIAYASVYHQFYLKAMLDRSFVAAAIAWNLADFSSEERGETDPHLNNKGLLTIDRKPKDTYYFYQANLLKQPFIKIGMGNRTVISGTAANHNNYIETVPVYSNQPMVSLTVNGKKLGEKQTLQGIANFEVEFKNGQNYLHASTVANNEVFTAEYAVVARVIPAQLTSTTIPFSQLNVSLGDTRTFTEETSQQVWLPEQAYTKGSWGYMGGKRFAMKDTARVSFGSNKAVAGTDLDPIYQTQRVGIAKFIADVKPGKYEVTLHFAELLSAKPQEALAYDLGAKTPVKDEFTERLFDVQLNGVTVLKSFGQLEPARAESYKMPVTVTDDNGIIINFIPIKGEAILNGIQIRSIY